MQHKQHKRTFKFVAAAATVTFVGAMVAVIVPSASAAPIAITTSGEAYSPKTATVAVGDIVNFSNIGSHQTLSTEIPAGAATFSSTGDTLAYTVTAPGVYNYICTDHDGMGGSFTAAGAAAPATGAPATGAPATGAPAAEAPAAEAPAAEAPAAEAPAAEAPAAAAAAVTHKVVTGPGDVFTPAAIDVKVGDSVSITGLGSHPSKSDVFPAGAAPIAMTTADITYKVTVPGKYTYLCIAHSGMKGSFTATGVAAAAGAAAAPAGTPAGQVSSIPTGGVQTGGGSTAGLTHSGLIGLGGGLLIAAFMSLSVSRRFARQK